MWGAVVGDVIGSVYERKVRLQRTVPLFTPESTFTDDTVFTLAVSDSILGREPLGECFRRWNKQHRAAGASPRFQAWLDHPGAPPYRGDTNGCLMRVSPAIALASSQAQALTQALAVTVITHDSEIAQHAVAVYAKALWAALRGATPFEVLRVLGAAGVALRLTEEIHLAGNFRMRADRTLSDVYSCLANARCFESAMRECIYCGGDVDTLCAVVGPIAEALWSIPEPLLQATRSRLNPHMVEVLSRQYQVNMRESGKKP